MFIFKGNKRLRRDVKFIIYQVWFINQFVNCVLKRRKLKNKCCVNNCDGLDSDGDWFSGDSWNVEGVDEREKKKFRRQAFEWDVMSVFCFLISFGYIIYGVFSLVKLNYGALFFHP